MIISILRRGAALALFLLGLAGVSAPAEARVLPPALKAITNPPSGSVDNLFEVAPAGSGFLLTWARSVGSIPPFTLYAQKFTSTGKAQGRATVIDGPGTVGDTVKALPLGATTMGLFWMKNGHFWGAKLSLSSMAVSARTDFGKSDDHIHDVALLGGGKIALITAQIDVSNPFNLRYRNMIKVVSSSFATVHDWTSLHGTGFPLDGWAYVDQTVVASNAGGVALFRDHVTGRYMGQRFSTGGGLTGRPFALNTTALTSTSISDLPFLQVQAAQLSNGKIAACWVSVEIGGSDRYEVRCRLLKANGTPAGPDFLANTTTAGGQAAPEVIALPGGKFMVSWTQLDLINPVGVMHRAFDGNGHPLGDPQAGVTFDISSLSLGPLNTESALLGDGSVATVIDQQAFTPGLRAFGVAQPGQ